jgi:division protein CdvB (Snf7/Vps24/ESCRT-III family)
MRELRLAVLAAIGLVAVGCGPVPSSDKVDTGKAKDAVDKGKDVVSKASEKAGEVGDLAGKLKGATEEINKELDPLKKAFDNFKEKFAADEKAAGTDAAKMTAVSKLRETKDSIEKLLKEITDKIGGLAGLKDVASLDKLKKEIMDLIEKVKPMLKDFMPKG